MNADRDVIEGMGENFSLLQKFKKEMTADLYFDLVEDARALSASASVIALSSSLRDGDDISVVT